MKTKYYVSVKEWFRIYWMEKNGVYYTVYNGRTSLTTKDSNGVGYDWMKLLEKGVIREVQLEELAFLF